MAYKLVYTSRIIAKNLQRPNLKNSPPQRGLIHHQPLKMIGFALWGEDGVDLSYLPYFRRYVELCRDDIDKIGFSLGNFFTNDGQREGLISLRNRQDGLEDY
jgi:hypothetical protein